MDSFISGEKGLFYDEEGGVSCLTFLGSEARGGKSSSRHLLKVLCFSPRDGFGVEEKDMMSNRTAYKVSEKIGKLPKGKFFQLVRIIVRPIH